MSNETAINATEYALDKRAEEIAHQILVAAGSGINHYTSQSRERIVRKAREQIEALSGRNPEGVEGLEKALEKAIGIADSWIHGQLDGTTSLKSALEELEPCRAALAKYRGEA